MTLTANDLILHQYELSPFSEKARLMMGFKDLDWHACIHSTIMPKPELITLTGGYRQIPVLQLGADIYCGTELIADELQRLKPEPSLFRASGEGIGRGLAVWSDEALFWVIVEVVCGAGFESCKDEAFNKDREEMLGTFDILAKEAALPQNIVKLRAHLDLVERQLADGRPFLFGPLHDYADFCLYHAIEFISNARGGIERIVDEYPSISAWLPRVAATGHGRRHETTRETALAVARAATPVTVAQSTTPDGPQPGDKVRFRSWAPAGRDIEGELVVAAPRRFAIRRHDPDIGEVVVHLPRNAGDFV